MFSYRALVLVAAMLVGTATPAIADDLKFTPPGQVLLAACAEVRSSTPGGQAMLQRGSCLRFIEATLMLNRLLTFGHIQETQPRISIPASPGALGFCYPHQREFGVDMIEAANVAEKFVRYLRTVPAPRLERFSKADDPHMRLLVEFLTIEYPCPGK